MSTETTTEIDGATALERSYDGLVTVVQQLSVEDLARPTNCPEWSVSGLLDHILGGALMYIGANNGDVLDEDAGAIVGDDPAAAVATIAAENITSWRAPGALDGERVYPWATMPAPWGLLVNVTEVAVHTWDLATATGQTASIDAAVAQVAYDFYRQVPMDDMRATGVYGPEIPVPDSASIQDRLLGYLSRQP